MIQFKAFTRSGEFVNSAVSPFAFPAGERHVKREDRRQLEPVEVAVLTPSPESLNDDLFQLALWNEYLLKEGSNPKRVLLMPYVPAARADRGNPFGAKVYAQFIDGLNLDHIAVYDPHSAVSENLLAGAAPLTVLDPSDVLPKHLPEGEYDYVIAPDKGAYARAKGVADAIGVPLIQGEKKRDFVSGKLTGYALPELEQTKQYLVVDDICDGGGTFILLAQAANVPYGNLHLYVSHGVFSNDGFRRLTGKFYSKIISTNSFHGGHPGPNDGHHRVIEVTRPLREALPEELRRPGKPLANPFDGGMIISPNQIRIDSGIQPSADRDAIMFNLSQGLL